MSKKIDKNYLGETLSHLDINGDKVIEPQEWVAFFDKYSDDLWNVTKMMFAYILRDMSNDNNLERLTAISENILLSNTDNTNTEENKINLLKLYDYMTRMIAPKQFRDYQKTLKNPQRFFLYDGVLQPQDFEMFYTANNTRILVADIYYLFISFNLSPQTTFEVINYLLEETGVDYDVDDFTLNGNRIFEILAIQKELETIIDSDALLNYAHKQGIEINISDNFKFFDIHTQILEEVQAKGQIDYSMAYNFFNSHHKECLQKGILSLFHALSIDLQNTDAFLNLISSLGYVGQPNKLFREISGNTRHFGVLELKNFLDDNSIKYFIK